MNLDKLQITAEHRSNWQAIDLGVLMAKRWYRPLLLSWLIPALILFIPLSVWFYESPWIAMLVVWWCKPLLERAPLFLLSRYLFNDDPLKQSGYRSLHRLYWFDMFSALTWRRLDLKRSFNLAVTVLEQQKGSARSKRCTVLQSGCGSSAGWLTIALVHLEAVLCIGFIVLLVMLMPQHYDWAFMEPLLDHPLLFEHIYNALYFSAIALIAPIYTACGFSLYINRRIELEAWDLELIFRHNMQKRSSNQRSAATLLIFGVFGLFTLLQPQPLLAATMDQSQRELAKESILQTLESPPFVIEKKVSEWSWPDNQSDAPPADVPDWLKNLGDFRGLAEFIESIALLIEVCVWIAIGLLLLYIGKQLYTQVRQNATPRPERVRDHALPPELIMGMQISRASLPEDIPAAVEAALQQGDQRLALSLLYRYSLSQLVSLHQIPLKRWHTEGECAELAKRTAPQDISLCFSELTRLWQQQAYAHQAPSDTRIRAMCDQVGRLFQA
ncbi:DUF4129 domain-containing protein [Neptuniibacter halophilus]|uniref:DUF4129 domain-containing protein n=1 Tax=Neptuniibacter halophilus TaxID=651666 RepID=UPI002572E0CA|nr:DUF4129 domain-containing protein [Neptuniibacter halophilus]